LLAKVIAFLYDNKICSDVNKPDGQTYLAPNEPEITKFMSELPVRKIPGVGKVNELILQEMGIKLCRDVIEQAASIYINFTENAFDFLIKASLGIYKNVHDQQGLKKSLNISKSVGLLSEYEPIKEKIRELCQELEARATEQKLSGRTLTVEFKNDKYKNKQKSFTQHHYMATFDQFYPLACQLLDNAWPVEPVRHLQIKLLNLRDQHGNLSFSTTAVLQATQGKSRLGGNPKIEQPKLALHSALAEDAEEEESEEVKRLKKEEEKERKRLLTKEK